MEFIARWRVIVCTTIGAIWLSCSIPVYGIDNGTNIADNLGPSVGIVRIGATGWGTGTLLDSNISPAKSFVLTAGHVIDGQLAGNMKYRPTGASGTDQNVAQLILHPNYAGDAIFLNEDNDIALMRLQNVVNGITPSPLNRTQRAVGDTLRLVGFGLPQNQTNLPNNFQKRFGDFTIDQFSPNQREWQADQPPPAGAAVSRGGDSGGPYFFPLGGPGIAGVHEEGDNVNKSNATAVFPYLDWLDSHTRKAIFWDNLRITGAAVNVADDFSGVYAGGIAPNWTKTAVAGHPNFGNIAIDNTDWRYIDAIAFDNDAADGSHSQGEIMLGTASSVIKRTFPGLPMNTAISLDIDQRFNSIGLANDVGLQIGNGPITWASLSVANGGNLDQFLARNLNANTGGSTEVTVYLLNAVPEPSAILLAMAGGALLLLTRLHSRRRRAA